MVRSLPHTLYRFKYDIVTQFGIQWIPIECRCPENGRFNLFLVSAAPPPPLSEGCVMLVASRDRELVLSYKEGTPDEILRFL
jgi:hypothetical protein